jgi:hypothetical protein
MNQNPNSHWQNLVKLGAPAFKGDEAPPYGFTTHLLANLRSEEAQSKLIEKIGLRALFTSLATFAIICTLLICISYAQQPDLEPGIRSLLNIPNLLSA